MTNNSVGAHPGMHVHLVKVRITESDPVLGDRTGIWTIRDLPVGGSARRDIHVPHPRGNLQAGPAIVARRLYAEIIESDPVEPPRPRFQFNNATEHWVTIVRRPGLGISRFTNANAGVQVAGVSDRSPGVGGATTITIKAVNNAGSIGRRGDEDHTLFDVQVEISLSPGLAFAADQQAPAGTSFDTDTGIWTVGTLKRGTVNVKLLPVEVNLTADSLADLPLEERCLTAKVVRAVPWFASDPSKRKNDTATACLWSPSLLAPGRNSPVPLPRLRRRNVRSLHRRRHAGTGGGAVRWRLPTARRSHRANP